MSYSTHSHNLEFQTVPQELGEDSRYKPMNIRKKNYNTSLIHILHIEDDPAQIILIEEALSDARNFQCSVEHASMLSHGLQKLSNANFDIILLDLKLPDSDGIETFQELKNLNRDIPIIVMTGFADETIALQAVRLGAQDYLFKGQTDVNLLIRSIRYAIEREKLSAELRNALARIKTLSGMIPICASCKKIRDDHGFWHQVEVYVRNHSNAEFTHGLCPTCAEKYIEDLFNHGE